MGAASRDTMIRTYSEGEPCRCAEAVLLGRRRESFKESGCGRFRRCGDDSALGLRGSDQRFEGA